MNKGDELAIVVTDPRGLRICPARVTSVQAGTVHAAYDDAGVMRRAKWLVGAAVTDKGLRVVEDVEAFRSAYLAALIAQRDAMWARVVESVELEQPQTIEDAWRARRRVLEIADRVMAPVRGVPSAEDAV